ncbi:hypothetical protein [Larkinella arboricola]
MTPDQNNKLDHLIELNRQGVLTNEEFAAAKERLLGTFVNNAPSVEPKVEPAQNVHGPNPSYIPAGPQADSRNLLIGIGLVLLVFFIVRYISNSSEKLDRYDNPTQKAKNSAGSYSHYFLQLKDQKKYKDLSGLIESRLAAYDSLGDLEYEYDSKIFYEGNQNAKAPYLALAPSFTEWEAEAKEFIVKNGLTQDYEKYTADTDAEFAERQRVKKETYLNRSTLVKVDIMQELSAAEIPCFNVEIAESGCVWVYTTDTGSNRDGLASTLCSTAKKHFYSCITIVDKNQNSLGRSYCK